ncbi:Cupin domain protein [Novipirellula aureliae]|uniref:Cupin domain protein n=1 Tax=Novipirellula aureliae TaxID=2527966 RepID=A0A5C6DS04_9BACT|nr:cupin domain-containing protein [Novipirellula aureliae]TWU40093.1 Cupin domain protein [Novipirellula aureliae]
MAIHHAQAGEIVDVRPLADALAQTKTTTLVKTEHLEVLRLVMPAAKEIAEHKAKGDVTIQCLEGRVTFDVGGKSIDVTQGDLFYLPAKEPHSVRFVEDSSLLVTFSL